MLSNRGLSRLPQENLQAVEIKGRILRQLWDATNYLRENKREPVVLPSDFRRIYSDHSANTQEDF